MRVFNLSTLERKFGSVTGLNLDKSIHLKIFGKLHTYKKEEKQLTLFFKGPELPRVNLLLIYVSESN